MQLLLRLIAILLVLTTGGVFQTLAFASNGAEACAGEEEGDRCADCALDCGVCLCCPLRATPVTSAMEVPTEVPLPEPALACVREPTLSGAGADIFQPPRA
ncbi:hypothetical protein JQX13_48665 [Archangium violaceum]|uniref:hypothetical protein n=1 Tax=Archangium violaceum TaxID=83451 RepID=UPI00193B4C5B|nr:hypothetical protein [Archangium violaceum]QRK07774.1 hypothetical protein JQX13_48665 [Archangium violaceum]